MYLHPWAEGKRLSEIERATEQRLGEIERVRAEQLDIARSWILLFTLAATVGLWWVFYNQLKLFYLSGFLGFVVGIRPAPNTVDLCHYAPCGKV